MGQPLPLPERIPRPDTAQMLQLFEMGITLEADAKSPYWRCAPPTGWHWENESWRTDLPNWHLVDAQSLIRLSVSGSWKGSYDNVLTLRIHTTPMPWKPSFNTALRRYNATMDALEGCGARAIVPAEEAYRTLCEAYDALPDDERARFDKPSARPVTDDGTGGISSGLGAMSRVSVGDK